MDTESAPNYGVAMDSRDERMWSGLAHLSVFLNLFTGFLGPMAAFVIWLVYRDRSETIAFHALQSAVYQSAWLLFLAVGWTLTGLLAIVLVGFLLMPFMFVASVVPFAHAVYAAYRIGQGREFRYPFASDMVDGK
ncbi:MAG: DUF4870 domain-containing protein [Rubrobacter sp.]|nr:DUF4870 domain-containing protein [Rubrobacter sp.]